MPPITEQIRFKKDLPNGILDVVHLEILGLSLYTAWSISTFAVYLRSQVLPASAGFLFWLFAKAEVGLASLGFHTHTEKKKIARNSYAVWASRSEDIIARPDLGKPSILSKSQTSHMKNVCSKPCTTRVPWRLDGIVYLGKAPMQQEELPLNLICPMLTSELSTKSPLC